MRTDGSEQRQITRLGAISWAPYFHPSGDYLVFASSVEGPGNFELYLVDAEGRSAPVRVTQTEGFDGLPVFAPDRQRLAWTSSRTAGGQAQIFLADWDDAGARRLLGLPPSPEASPGPSDVALTAPEISASDLRLDVTWLASDALGGRLTGTNGERRATEYVAEAFRTYGLTPAGYGGTFFQTFEFTAGVSLGPANRLGVRRGEGRGGRALAADSDWRPLGFSAGGTFEASRVVFAGFGIVAPAGDGQIAYDSVTGIDVAGKWALVFRYLPEGGPAGLIAVSGPNASVRAEPVPLAFDAALAGSGLAAISVTDRLAAELLEPSGKGLLALQSALDGSEPVAGFEIPGLTVEAAIDVQQERRPGRSVLARLPSGRRGGEALVVGAHVDHLGTGVATATLARGKEQGQLHHGADDNASGVAGVLEIAQYLADEKAAGRLPMQRDVLFAGWSGEELEILGSSHFARTFGGAPTEPATLSPRIAAYLNMDMIGRLDRRLVLLGVGSSSLWRKQIERWNVPLALSIAEQDKAYMPTDATAFAVKGVPVLSAFTGAHEHYHTPRDTAEKINYQGAERITRLMAAMTRAVATAAQRPDYVESARPPLPGGRMGLRAYLGTIPDYAAADVVGVKLSGAAKGGPAERAGLRGGDVVVEIGGKKIGNIYDYTYALELVKIGVPVQITIRRGERPLTVTVEPTSRD